MRSRWQRSIGAAGLATACLLLSRKNLKTWTAKNTDFGGTNHVLCFGGYENAATVQGACTA